MKGGDQAPVGDGAPPAEGPLADAENSPLHSMMIYDSKSSEEKDGIHKTQKSIRGGLKYQIVRVTLIVIAIVGLLTLSLTIWAQKSGSSQKKQKNNATKKTSWPELVGEPGLQAQETILQENSDITVAPLVALDSMVTLDYRTDRVWIFVNDDGDQTVALTPMIG